VLSQGRRVWSFARTSLKVKSKVKVTRDKKVAFWPFWRPACSLCFVKHLLPLVWGLIYGSELFVLVCIMITDLACNS